MENAAEPAENRTSSGTGRALAPGLHMVATPIGAARDVTLRALDILRDADVIAAEDTRTARKLMELHGVPAGGRPFVAYHDHNGPEARPRLIAALQAGRSVAYVSEAGTPMVADPGYQLVRAAVAEGLAVFAVPGASAALAALVVSGLPSDRFLFAGFPPGRGARLRTWLEAQAAAGATTVLYESPKRAQAMLEEIAQVWGPQAPMALCRELTKRHEEVIRGPIAEVAEAISDRTLKGEVVLVLGPRPAPAADPDAVEAALRAALTHQKVKQAAAEVADQFHLPRRDVYQLALKLREGD